MVLLGCWSHICHPSMWLVPCTRHMWSCRSSMTRTRMSTSHTSQAGHHRMCHVDTHPRNQILVSSTCHPHTPMPLHPNIHHCQHHVRSTRQRLQNMQHTSRTRMHVCLVDTPQRTHRQMFGMVFRWNMSWYHPDPVHTQSHRVGITDILVHPQDPVCIHQDIG